MGAAELYAAILRISLWVKGQLQGDTLQQEMTIKNILFLGSAYGAYSMWSNSRSREWNSPNLVLGFRLPSRDFQRQVFRWLFVVTYLLQGILDF
jgi:hypothetical protein